jgi:hypothetical protein
MNPNIIAALISTGGTTLIAIIAIVQQARSYEHLKLWFQSEFRRLHEHGESESRRLDQRFESESRRSDQRFDDLQKYLDVRFEAIEKRLSKLEEAAHSPIVRT